MQNFIIRFELGKYNLYIDDKKYELYIWTEGDKTYSDGSPKLHLRHKELMTLTGRNYIAKRLIDNAIKTHGQFAFEYKNPEEHRSGLGWSEYMTAEEKQAYEAASKTIETIKAACIERSKKPLTEEEKLERRIAALMAKKAKLAAAKN